MRIIEKQRIGVCNVYFGSDTDKELWVAYVIGATKLDTCEAIFYWNSQRIYRCEFLVFFNDKEWRIRLYNDIVFQVPWTIWGLKIINSAFNILWKELPKNMYELYIDTEFGVLDIMVKRLPRPNYLKMGQ